MDAFDAWLWALDRYQLSELSLRGLARRAASDGVSLPQLTMLTIIADSDEPFSVLARAAGRGALHSKETAFGGIVWSRLRDKDYLVSLWKAGAEGVYHVVSSVPFTDGRWRRVEESWLRAAAPKLAPVILNRDDFEDIGDALSEHGTVEVSRMSARVLADHSSYTRGWHSDTVRRRPSHREALQEAERMLVRTLTLRLGERLALHLRRQAGATYYRGDFELFTDVVLGRLSQAAADRRALLSGREREPQALVEETLVMSLDEPLLATQHGRGDLLQALGALRGVQTAVLHRNPYLHLIVTDFLDGSSFDVLVTDDSHLHLIPGIHASLGSLARLTEAMGEAMGMDRLDVEVAPQLIPDEEFFGVG
ncbi:MAG: hypothetical protein ACRDL0_03105 [Thermoleophilaceae bacterium]